jgi:hypothetical protein
VATIALLFWKKRKASYFIQPRTNQSLRMVLETGFEIHNSSYIAKIGQKLQQESHPQRQDHNAQEEEGNRDSR